MSDYGLSKAQRDYDAQQDPALAFDADAFMEHMEDVYAGDTVLERLKKDYDHAVANRQQHLRVLEMEDWR